MIKYFQYIKTYKTIDQIFNKFSKIKKYLNNTLLHGIPKAGLFPALVFYSSLKHNTNKQTSLTIVDTINDTGSTFETYLNNFKFVSKFTKIQTLAILSKERSSFIPDYVLFDVLKYKQDLWFYGFGMDLIPGNIINSKIDPFRNLNFIAYCEPVISKRKCNFHIMYQILKNKNRMLLDKCDLNDCYDFRLLFKRSRELKEVQNES